MEKSRTADELERQLREAVCARAQADPRTIVFIANGLQMSAETVEKMLTAERWNLALTMNILDILDLEVAVDVAPGNMVERARAFQRHAHEGQVDKLGQPYHLHPEAAAEKVRDYGPLYEVGALLHDTVEDTDTTVADIRREFGPWPAQIVDALTKRPGEPKRAYYSRVVADPIGDVVKEEGDMAHNSDPERLAVIAETDPATANRLDRKYAEGRLIMAELRNCFRPSGWKPTPAL